MEHLSRRDFMKLAGISVAALALRRCIGNAPTPPPSDTEMPFTSFPPTPTEYPYRFATGSSISAERLAQMKLEDPTVEGQIRWLEGWAEFYDSLTDRPMTATEGTNDIMFYAWQDQDGNTHYKAVWKLPGYEGFVLTPPSNTWDTLNFPAPVDPPRPAQEGEGPFFLSTEVVAGSDLANLGVPVGAQLAAEYGTGDWVMVSADAVVARVNEDRFWEMDPTFVWLTAMKTQDPDSRFFRIVDGKPVINPYDTEAEEVIVLNSETIVLTATTDTSNQDVLSAYDIDGVRYALNPELGWFKIPEVQMDYMKLTQYTKVDRAFIEDGRANITTALLYAENPTISPDAIDPVYWVNYYWMDKVSGDRIPMLCNNACGNGYEAWLHYPEEEAKIYYDATNKPFAWTGFYEVQLDSGDTIIVVGRTLKNPSETSPDQTINLFYGFDKQTWKNWANSMLPTQQSLLEAGLKTVENGGSDMVVILPPPTILEGNPISFNLSPNDWITGGNPMVAGLQERGELISLFDPVNLQIITQLLLHSSRQQLDFVAPLTQPLPVEFSKFILLAGFVNR